MRVYLDDERKPPEGWQLVKWPDEAIALLEQGVVEEISLDHDLGDATTGHRTESRPYPREVQV